MFYNFSLSAFPGEGLTTGNKTTLKLTHGIIHKVDIVFPPGPQGLFLLFIFDNTHQVFPTNPGGYFSGDDEIISWREHLPLLYDPFELYAYYYNFDDTFAHTVTLRIGILPVKVLAPWLLPYDERILAALGSD